MSAFVLKLIAMISMVIDHVGFRLMHNNHTMRGIGRLAFIIYVFLIAESCFHLRSNPKRLRFHMIKLLLLAVVSEIPFDLFEHKKPFDLSSQNVIFTLALGFAALILSGCVYRKMHQPDVKHLVLSYVSIATIWLCAAGISYIIRSEYKFAGVLLVGMFYIFLCHWERMNLPQRFLSLILLFAVYLLIYLWSRSGFSNWSDFVVTAQKFKPRFIGTIASIIPIALYNRKLGYRSKWFNVLYSIFYPLQFLILVGIMNL